MHGLLGGRNELLPLLGAERFVKLACVVLNLLYALAQTRGGAARSRRRIVKFMGKPGCHRAKLDELLALLCVAGNIAQSCRHRRQVRSRSQNSARGRRKSRLSATAR